MPSPHPPEGPRGPDRTDVTERTAHLRTMAAAGALATLGAFVALAASSEPATPGTQPTPTDPSVQLRTPDAAPSPDPEDTSPQAGFSEPQGDFFGAPDASASPVVPQQSVPGTRSAPSMSGAS